MRTRRDKMQILEDILRSAEDSKGSLKTHLVYGSNLNFSRLEGYLSFLIEKEMIKLETSDYDRYFITEKGVSFLNMMKETRAMLGS